VCEREWGIGEGVVSAGMVVGGWWRGSEGGKGSGGLAEG